jgi:hypothetical protein
MTFPCKIERLPNGKWRITYSGSDVGTVESIAASREQAIEKMHGELRYRLELCPCSGESYQHLKIELTEQGQRVS